MTAPLDARTPEEVLLEDWALIAAADAHEALMNAGYVLVRCPPGGRVVVDRTTDTPTLRSLEPAHWFLRTDGYPTDPELPDVPLFRLGDPGVAATPEEEK